MGIYYLITLFLSVFFFVILITMMRDQAVIGFELLFGSICVVNLAYWCQSISKTTQEALLANSFSCIDATFLTFFLVLCMLQISKVKIKRWFMVSGMALSIISLSSVFTYMVSDLYVESASITFINGYSHLDKVYGPLRNLFLAVLVFYFIVTIGIVIHAFRQRKKVSYIYTIALAAIEIVTIGSFVFETVANLYFEILPFVYVFMEIMLLFIAGRTRMYEVSRNSQITKSALKEYGYIMFDNKFRYTGSDDVASMFFPELNELEIDQPVEQRYIKEEFIDWIASSGDYAKAKVLDRGNKHLWCKIKPLYFDWTGRQIGYMIEIRDDTERQNYIRELSNVNEKLKSLAKEADEANQAKSSFLSSMSHEIRTPINTIMGMNEMILRETDDETVTEYANDVKNASNMLLSLVNDILDFSKIESGKMELIPVEYEPHALLHELNIMIRTRAELKDLKFYIHTPEKLPAVLYGDEMRIRQMILNLLTNAVKYTDNGSVTLEMKMDYSGDDKKKPILYVRVSDTGRGITEEGLKNLFNSFSRVDEAKNRGIEGTGLGLAITKRFVEMMDGEVSVSSEYGIGTTFELRIPQIVVKAFYTQDEIHERDLGKKSIGAAANGELPLPKANILVADDVFLNLKVFTSLLKKTPLLIDTVDNGRLAYERCLTTKYDVVFVDHMMPEMDGVECLKKIRQDERSLNKETPVIMLTANAIQGAKEEYLSEGFSAYLSKPFDPLELNRVLYKYLVEDKNS